MAIDSMMSDSAVLLELGHRLSRRRVELALTQADLAREAGVAKRTVERIEAGDPTQTTNLIRVLRTLNLFDALNAAIPEGGPRPMELLKLKGKERQRVYVKKQRKQPDGEWSWGDES